MTKPTLTEVDLTLIRDGGMGRDERARAFTTARQAQAAILGPLRHPQPWRGGVVAALRARWARPTPC
ncbi:MAG: hypothetical protein AAF914_04655 [Pseudomonadota bacterium]